MNRSCARARSRQRAPKGPTYVVLDVGLQELKLDAVPAVPEPRRYLPPEPVGPSSQQAEAAAKMLLGAERPLILMGRVSRSESAWAERVKLAEALGAVVLTDLKLAAAFPTDHPLLGSPPGTFQSGIGAELVRNADAILLLDWVDPAGTFKSTYKNEPVGATVINVSLDQHLHRGWSMDYQGLPPVDLQIMADTDPTVSAILAAAAKAGGRKKPAWPNRKPFQRQQVAMGDAAGPIAVPMLAAAMQQAVEGRTISLIRHPLSWAGHLWPMKHPLGPSRQRRRRRRRLGPGHDGGRGPRAPRQRPAAGRDPGRRRFHDGQQRHLDGRPLSHPVPRRHRQQPLLL